MSAPFDPSKFDLDINKMEEEKTPEISEKKKETLENKIENTKQEDILATVDKNTDEKHWKDSPDDSASKDSKEDIDTTEKEQITKETVNQEKQEGKDTEKTAGDTGLQNDKDKAEEKKLIDINIESLTSIITLINENEYDYVLIEPEDMQVKITFKQDNIDRDIKYIKFPTYTNILFKIKQATKMVIEDTNSSQEWKGEVKIWTVNYKLAAKTASWQNGENIWIKAVQDTSKKDKAQVKKMSLSMIFGFLWAILFVWLVLGEHLLHL